MDAVGAQLLRRGVDERARRGRAGGPQAAAGHRAARAPPVTWISVAAPGAHALAQEDERLLGDRAGPAAEVLDRRLVERAAAERAGLGRPRRARRR